MPATTPRKRIALDTNLVLDLAGGADFAHDFRETFQGKGYVLCLPPTAIAELHENFLHGTTPAKRDLARTALLKLREWEIQPLDLANLEVGIAEQFARRLLHAGLLPPEEQNDALILAETAVAGIPILATSDKHLLETDETALKLIFDEADLPAVSPLHPRRLLRAIR